MSHFNILAQDILTAFLKPLDYEWTESFEIDPRLIHSLCDAAISILKKEPMVVHVKPPVKIFGALHGQIRDLLRFFYKFGVPDKNSGYGMSDIEAVGYVFLGNYVDRGRHSLEVICLLLALKIKHPKEIILLRGAHEDPRVNSNEGLGLECESRLGDNIRSATSVFAKLNSVFEYLPMACTIDNRVLCVPSGIGERMKTIQEIAELPKPLVIDHDGVITPTLRIAFDLLWSDPVQSLEDRENQPNKNRSHVANGTIIRFGVRRIFEFLKSNKFHVLIRSHEPVVQGVEQFGETNLFTVFSATDYCGSNNNNGALLYFKKHRNEIKTLSLPPDNVDPAKKWYTLGKLKRSFLNRSMFIGADEEPPGFEPRESITPMRSFKVKKPSQKK